MKLHAEVGTLVLLVLCIFVIDSRLSFIACDGINSFSEAYKINTKQFPHSTASLHSTPSCQYFLSKNGQEYNHIASITLNSGLCSLDELWGGHVWSKQIFHFSQGTLANDDFRLVHVNVLRSTELNWAPEGCFCLFSSVFLNVYTSRKCY